MEKQIKVAICYDFDGTLSPGNMQEYGFMETLGIAPQAFWQKVNKLAAEQNSDSNLCWMKLMLDEASARGKVLYREDFWFCARSIQLFAGVPSWFNRINDYGRKHGVEVQHFLLSSGLREIVEALPVSKAFNRLYACSFMYDENGRAIWPSQVVNYTTKTQYLYRISKGCLEQNDTSVNDKFDPDDYAVPFRHMLYIGDGITDVPCMSTLKKFGGHAAAVYDPEKENAQKIAENLRADGRVDFIAPADYRQDQPLSRYVWALIDKIVADHRLQNI